MAPVFLSDYTEDEKRDIMEAMDKSKGPMVALPSGCTVTSVFPGDLRDWFAGMAMSGMMSNRSYFGVYSGAIPFDDLSKEFYQLADAMLKARATSTEGER